jgi:hypothetical protein
MTHRTSCAGPNDGLVPILALLGLASERVTFELSGHPGLAQRFLQQADFLEDANAALTEA